MEESYIFVHKLPALSGPGRGCMERRVFLCKKNARDLSNQVRVQNCLGTCCCICLPVSQVKTWHSGESCPTYMAQRNQRGQTAKMRTYRGKSTEGGKCLSCTNNCGKHRVQDQKLATLRQAEPLGTKHHSKEKNQQRRG